MAIDYAKKRKQLRDTGIPLHQWDEEFSQLLERVNTLAPNVFVEIGSAFGGSLWMISQYVKPGATIVSIDMPLAKPNSQAAKKLVAAQLRMQGAQVHLLEASSQVPETIDTVRSILKERLIDFLFVDGNHQFPAVLADWTNYYPLVRGGGLIALHDIVQKTERRRKSVPQVWMLWRALATILKHEEFVSKPKRGRGIGILWKPE
jgi:cephalosporin hydroxylase